MLRSLKKITGYTLQETDDIIGTCADFLFDDKSWVIRYMVADTGNWLIHNKVLITPNLLGESDWQTEKLQLKLTREQLEACPPLDLHAPISREYEILYHEHFEIPFYWMGADFREGMPNTNGAIDTVDNLPLDFDENTADEPSNEGQLRSAIEVMDYSVSTNNKNAGRVDDIIVDGNHWTIHHFSVDTGHIIPGRKISINTEWIDSINWEKQYVAIDSTHMTR